MSVCARRDVPAFAPKGGSEAYVEFGMSGEFTYSQVRSSVPISTKRSVAGLVQDPVRYELVVALNWRGVTLWALT